MSSSTSAGFFDELKKTAHQVTEYLLQERYTSRFHPEDLRRAVTLYIQGGGKRLRPAILLWSCGALGGTPDEALPAASAVELFHTWTLVHDDIVDRDETRRGGLTAHAHFAQRAQDVYPGIADEEAVHYGHSVAILGGDVQHGWATSLLTELAERGVHGDVVLQLIARMDNQVLNLLVEGELLDIQFCHLPIEALDVEAIEDMLWKKTGVLYRFCAQAGGMIALNTPDSEDSRILPLVEFADQCGIAFQLQDDLLGVIGDAQKTGKPVGGDIREGKRTSLIFYAYQRATAAEKKLIGDVLGDPRAGDANIREVIDVLERRGGIQRTRELAQQHIEHALTSLKKLPENRYTELLRAWAEFMVERQL